MSFTIILSFNFGHYIQRKSELETHFPDLNWVPNLECVLENKNALTISTVLFMQFLFRSILLLIVSIFLRTRSKRSIFFRTMGSFLIVPIVPPGTRPALAGRCRESGVGGGDGRARVTCGRKRIHTSWNKQRHTESVKSSSLYFEFVLTKVVKLRMQYCGEIF